MSRSTVPAVRLRTTTNLRSDTTDSGARPGAQPLRTRPRLGPANIKTREMNCVCGHSEHQNECRCGCTIYEPDDGKFGEQTVYMPNGHERYSGIYNNAFY